MNKTNAIEKYGSLSGVRNAEELKTALPSKTEIIEFWQDIKNISWPENYGESIWSYAGWIAGLVDSIAKQKSITNASVLNSDDYKTALSYFTESERQP